MEFDIVVGDISCQLMSNYVNYGQTYATLISGVHSNLAKIFMLDDKDFKNQLLS
jgi:hypothetical protein